MATTSINLSQIAPPDIVETLEFSAILAEIKALYVSLYPQFTADLESEPIVKLLEVYAYRELNQRARVNDAAKAVMLAFAKGKDLDQIGANYNVSRLLVTPANNAVIPPIAAVYENDEDFRARIQLSPEGYTTAGSEGSYKFHALSADGSIKDIQAMSPSPGAVSVYVLSRTGNGAPSATVLSKVGAALNKEDIRPLTDSVTVLSANIVEYSVVAELTLYDGPDSDVVVANAYSAVEDYAESVRKIGYDVTLSGLYHALHQPGVQSVKLVTPTANLVLGDGEASHLSALTVTKAATSDV